jgi:hypothetical protein
VEAASKSKNYSGCLKEAVNTFNEEIKEENTVDEYSWCAVRSLPESILNNRYPPYLDWLL